MSWAVATATDLISKHPRGHIFHTLLQFLVWDTPQTIQRISSPGAPHTVHEPVVMSLTTQDVRCYVGRARLHDHATEEPLVFTLISNNLATDADTACTLSPSALDDNEW